jgi:hypothetical protein
LARVLLSAFFVHSGRYPKEVNAAQSQPRLLV